MHWLLLALLAQDSSTSSPDLTLHYPSAQVSQTVASEMLDALDEEYARIRHELGCVIGSKVTAIVVSQQAWAALGHSPWAGAIFDGRIQVPLVYERSRVGPQMRKVFAHELVHACIARFGAFPTWLHEGLAQQLSGERLSETDRRQLRQVISSGKLPALQRFAGGWGGLSAAEAQLAYAYALMAAEAWLEADGAESIRQLLRNPDRVAQLTERLNQTLKR
ncbi:MAG: hypothetical protein ABIQ44_05020 [Chloroflexia bacterium]